MTAAELAAKLAELPGDTIMGIIDPDTKVAHHIVPAWPIKVDVNGVAVLWPSVRVITEEDVS